MDRNEHDANEDSTVATDDDLPQWKKRRMLEWKDDPDVLNGLEVELPQTEVNFWADMLNVSSMNTR